jgi:hypothetical protein
MKRLLVFVLLFISASNLFCQIISFNDTIRPIGSGADGLDNVIKEDSIFYISGAIYSNSQELPYILKIDNLGNLISKRLYEDSTYSYALYPYNSMILDDNKLLFCSQKWGDSLGTLGTVIAVNKNTLDTLWTKTYAHPDTLIAQTAADVFSVLTAIKATPDGNYILTGNYNLNCQTGNLRSFLMKIDSVGNVLWRRTYSDVTGLYDMDLVDGGGFLFILLFPILYI